MVCLTGTRIESRIVSPGHQKSSKMTHQSPVATLTQRRTTPFDVSIYKVTALSRLERPPRIVCLLESNGMNTFYENLVSLIARGRSS